MRVASVEDAKRLELEEKQNEITDDVKMMTSKQTERGSRLKGCRMSRRQAKRGRRLLREDRMAPLQVRACVAICYVLQSLAICRVIDVRGLQRSAFGNLPLGLKEGGSAMRWLHR